MILPMIFSITKLKRNIFGYFMGNKTSDWNIRLPFLIVPFILWHPHCWFSYSNKTWAWNTHRLNTLVTRAISHLRFAGWSTIESIEHIIHDISQHISHDISHVSHIYFLFCFPITCWYSHIILFSYTHFIFPKYFIFPIQNIWFLVAIWYHISHDNSHDSFPLLG